MLILANSSLGLTRNSNGRRTRPKDTSKWLGSGFDSQFAELHLGRTTLYDLCDEDDEPSLIIAELAKHATQAHLKPAKARDIISIGRSRFFHGDHPDATLWALAGLDAEGYTHSILVAAVAALKAQNPETDEAGRHKIIAHVRRADVATNGHDTANCPTYRAMRFVSSTLKTSQRIAAPRCCADCERHHSRSRKTRCTTSFTAAMTIRMPMMLVLRTKKSR